VSNNESQNAGQNAGQNGTKQPRSIATRMLMISALASGQGKTTVTAALARKLVNQGLRVSVCKVGADFIDPMLLESACGVPVQSLDLWMVGLDQCRRQLAHAASHADIILIEGVMGLYDGTPSSADLARVFGIPVLAVINASAMAQTAGAVAQGLRDYGPVELAGVLANYVAGPAHADMVAASLRDIPLFGVLQKQEQTLPERHLGLVPPLEVADLEMRLDGLAEQLSIDADAWKHLRPVRIDVPEPIAPIPPLLAGKTIAIASDVAFAFVYPANLDCLRALGAKLRFFSPLENEPVPSEADAVYLPGGYPELHAVVLSEADAWKASIRRAHQHGVPILAECGGMMAIVETLSDQHGDTWPMAGVMGGRVTMQKRLGGLGLQELSTPQGQLRGHTFHFSWLETDITPSANTSTHPKGEMGEAIYRVGSLTASYFHAYFPSCPEAVAALFLR